MRYHSTSVTTSSAETGTDPSTRLRCSTVTSSLVEESDSETTLLRRKRLTPSVASPEPWAIEEE